MLARNETIFKWCLYGAATFLCFLAQGAIFQRITLWGVIPFLYPVLAAVVGTLEGPLAGSIYALALGVVCDSLLPDIIPCFYTLIFPLVGLCGGLIAKGLLSAGFICSLVSSAAAFLLTDSFHSRLLWANQSAAWEAGAWTMVREFCVTAVLVIPVTLLFQAVFRKTHVYD